MMKMNMKIYVILLLFVSMKQKLNLFHKYEHKNKTNYFSQNK